LLWHSFFQAANPRKGAQSQNPTPDGKKHSTQYSEGNSFMPNCKLHPHTQLVCPSCIAAKNAGVTSKAKAKASARNGRLGGRPPKHAEGFPADCPRCHYDAAKAVREERDMRKAAK